MAHVRDSLHEFENCIEENTQSRVNGAPVPINADAILEKLSSGYTTDEQRMIHTGSEANTPADEEIEFF
jgi:hypothetical protein